MDEIEDVLREFASDDDFDAPSWRVQTSSQNVRVEAQTLQKYPDVETAFAEARSLVAKLLELGYELKGYTEIGASAVSPENMSDLPSAWRGKILLVMQPKIEERL